MASQQPEENETLEVDSLELDFTSSEVDAPAQSQPGTTQENREHLDKAKMYAMPGADSSNTAPKSEIADTEDSTFAGRERAAMDSRSIPLASHHMPCDQMPFGGERSTPPVGGLEAAAAPPLPLSQEPPDQDKPGDLSQDDVVLSFEDQRMTKAVDDLDVHVKEEDRPVEETLQETEESVSKYFGAQQQEERTDDEFEIEFPNTASSEHTHASKALGADGRGSQLRSTPVTSDTGFGGHRIMVKKEETATSTGTVCHVEEASMVLEQQSAQEEWDRVQTIEPVFARPDEVQRVAPSVEEKPILKYQQALEALSSADYSTVKRKIHAQVSRSGFQALKKFFFGPPKLHSHLWPEREMVFCFAGTPLQDGNKIHLDMLQSVYRQITGSRFECQRFGAHWESIGFQGNDPATDLRATGMLAVLQMMSLLGNPKVSPIARDAFRLSQDTYQNFPFCVIGINLTRTSLQTLREDLLNRECNRQNSVMNVMNEFYAGLFLKFYSIWKNGKTIIDSGHVMETINNFAKKNTKQVLVDLREHTSHSSASGPSDAVEFTNVCSSDH